ncbi:MAG TPA: class I SAM-dependent methyltransferase [Promicromonospora sp.]|uniref:class I SAM-dependent methyltransferase n=1 Tax=uncultured Georgenia sp. TaxID=378209 RepID=UPI002639290F|nr:class I SAM-dependent methyltransferase [uncultured Georgenia sp.]HEV6953765.1 class I SAM-dependent methyltransferase [Promicromonospora sp.]
MTTTQDTHRVPTAPETDDAGARVLGRLLQVLDDGATAILTGIGHDTGLFDTLAGLPPATSSQVADAAGLDERYVREWLGGVVSAGFVAYDPAAGTYALRPDHAPFLSGPGPDNLARMMRNIALMGRAAPAVTRAFRTGGGLRYADYPGFHALQADDTGPVQDALLIDVVLPLTGEVDRLRSGIDVVDIGCGQGHAVNLMARAFPRSRFTGVDLEEEAITAARAEAESWALQNATFVIHDVADLTQRARYDLVTAFDSIHDQAAPARVLANVARSLRPGGTFLMADIAASSRLEQNVDLPYAAFLYGISTVHCLSVSLAQGGAGLGAAWGVELAEQMLGEAGFSSVTTHRLETNPFAVYFVAKR